MKKLMVAVAALTAGVSFAEITSQNVVGYANTATPVSGARMVSGAFLTVNSEKTFKLGDLKFTGYDVEEGAWGSSHFQEKDTFGRIAVTEGGQKKDYYWFDYDDGEGDVKKGWYDADGEEKWDNAIEFDAGAALWTYGEGCDLVGAGSVNFTDVSVDTPVSGAVAVGNPYPTAIKLANISFSGYDVEEGAWGSSHFQEKDTFGRIAVKDDKKVDYYWFDYDDGEGDAKHGWYDADGEEKWDDATEFALGTGFWAYGEGCTLEFTCPIAK